MTATELANKTKLLKAYKELKGLQVQKGRENLQTFTQYTKPDYSMEWFHVIICYYLDLLERGVIKKLMIFVPPQHGKSELSSRRFPAFILGKNPRAKVGLVSYGSDLSNSFNSDVQSIIDDPLYRDLFPKTRLKNKGIGSKEKRNEDFFEVVGKKGSLRTVGVRGALTGNPLDFGIIDDPFKDRNEANSKATRNKVWQWYEDVFLTRLHNESRQLMLFTRWHEDDLAGRILNPKSEFYDKEEADSWTVLALPALRELTKPVDVAVDIVDPRKIGEALWESRHSRKKIELSKRRNPAGFNSLYQQRPTAQEGNKIKREWFTIKKASELPFNINNVSADFFIDGAFTEKTQNDETGLGSFYFNKYDGNLYVLNISGVRKELYELLSYFKTFARANYYKPSSKVFIELKASGYPLKSMLRKTEYGGFSAIGVNEKVVRLGKWNRVENSEGFIQGGRVILVEGAWNSSFIEQCVAFPNDTHDDKVDVLTYAIHHYLIRKSDGGVSYQN